MAFNSGYITSLFGRRIGLQTLSSAQSGGTRTPPPEYIVGPDDIRKAVSTAETTSSNLYPTGISFLTTAQSSGVYTLDPPVPGVEKTLFFGTSGTNPIYVKSANSETFQSSNGTSFTVLSSSNTAVYTLRLVGLTTAIWGVIGQLSTASLKLSTTT